MATKKKKKKNSSGVGTAIYVVLLMSVYSQPGLGVCERL